MFFRSIRKWIRRTVFGSILLAALGVGGGGYGVYRAGGIEPAREKLAAFWTQISETWANAPKPVQDGVALAQSTARTAVSTAQNAVEDAGITGSISIYFAPSNSLNPLSLDRRLKQFLSSAKKSLYCAFYEFEWQEAAEILVKQHQAGVDVRIVSDADYKDRPAIQTCIKAGIPVIFDEREPFMHNKFCVADGERVWTGSTNVTENCLFRNNNNSLWLESAELADDYTTEFGELFAKKFGGRSPRNTPHPIVTIDGYTLECYFAPEDDVEEQIVSEIRTAQRGIDVMAFSFTSKPIAEAMAKRIKDGVTVRSLFDDRAMGAEASRDDYLASQGARVFKDANRYAMHDKIIIIDGETVVTGSYNFTASANAKNDENALILHDPEAARIYTREFERLIAGK